MNKIFPSPEPFHIKRERQKAKKLRFTSWWKQKLDEGVCYFCKKTFSKSKLTMEHLIPLARGGLSIKNNLVVSCKNCNSNKKYKTIIESRLKMINKTNSKLEN